jgi:SWI/SNF-related matrix-associated actin-dependent regulator 1 of chromatin subfamily A
VTELYPYQRDAVDAIIARVPKPTYLAYEMGTGKTPIAIEVAKRMGAKRVLTICPAVGKLTWEKEIRRWTGKDPITISGVRDMPRLREDGWFIVSYSLLSMSKTGGYDYINGIKANASLKPFDMTVLDEAHALKNAGAIRTKAVLNTLLPVLGWVLPMSGTPAPNHNGELFPILNAIFPQAVTGALGKKMKLYEFENVYCRVVDKWFNGRSVRTIAGSQNIDQLKGKLDGFMHRKTKKQVLPDLPDLTFDTYPLAVSPAAIAAVKIVGTSLDGLSDDDFMAALAHDEHVMRVRHAIGLAKVQPACEAIRDALDGCRRKMLVFAHHRDVIAGLFVGLADYSPVVLTGETSKADREKAINRFLNDDTCRVFIGNILAAGTSITLVGDRNEVSDCWFVESDWSPLINVQAASRIHRIGQKSAVQGWMMTAHGTVDDRIQDITARKASDFAELFA